MSYNGSGTFVINSTGQPVVTGTVISSTVFNALTADLATGLSNVICKDGQTTVTNNIPFAGRYATNIGIRALDGSVTVPGIALDNDNDSGFYRIGSKNIGLALNGAKAWDYSTTAMVSGSNMKFAYGTSALATNATAGFFHVQSCAGAPTGTPASIPTGQIPMVYDSTNDRIYFFRSGTWRYVAVAP